MKNIAAIIFVVMSILLLPGCNGAAGPASPSSIYADTSYKRGTDISTARGQEIFNERCSDCHGLNGDKRKDNAANLKVSRIDSLSIVQRIMNGKAPMPPFGRLFSDSDMAQLVLYVKSLRRY